MLMPEETAFFNCLGRVEDGRDGSRGCSVSPPRSSNRTCGFPASGSPTGFTMKHTESSFASPYSSLGSFRSTTVFSGCAPITGPRLRPKHPEVRALPSTGITRLQRYYDPLRVPAGPLSLPRALELASTRSGVPPLPRPPSLHAVLTTPVDPNRCACQFLPGRCGLPRYSGGSASTTSLSRPAQASLALRPAGLLSHPKWPWSQGFGPARYRSKPLVSYQTYQQLSGWDFHPPVICAVGAH